MFNDEPDCGKKQRAIYNAIAGSMLEMSDEAMLSEAREAGADPARIAERVRRLFAAADREYEQRHLRQAAEQYRQSLAAIRSCTAELPAGADERREMLARLFARDPEIGSALLTAQHRQFKNLSDLDVTSLLVQLKALGALAEPGPTKGGEE